MKVIKIIAIIIASIVVLLFTFFHFSYEETPYLDVYIQKNGGNGYELTFRYQAKVSGNMHGPSLPFSSSTHDSARWFYVKSNDGKINVSEIILTNYQNCKDTLYWQKDMKGYIEISNNKVMFQIEMPRYDTPDGLSTNTVQRYEKWEHNGEYNLISEKPPALPVSPHDYRPSNCDSYP